MVSEVGKLCVWGIVVSIFQLDQNWNQLDPRKAVHILKTIFQYFYFTQFTLGKFLSNEYLSQYFPQYLLLGQVIFEYILYHINFLSLPSQQVLFTLRVSSLLSPLNDASADIVDDEGSFQFSPEAEFRSPSYVHITFATETEAETPCLGQLLQC